MGKKLKELNALCESLTKTKIDYNFWGTTLFNLFTEEGLPVEIAMDELEKHFKSSNIELKNIDKVAIIFKYHSLKMVHDFKSGMNEDKVKKKQQRNIKIQMELYNTGKIQ